MIPVTCHSTSTARSLCILVASASWRLLLLISVMASLQGRTVNASMTLTEAQKEAISTMIRASMECRHIPGMSLSVVNSDSVIWMTGFGVADVNTQDPVTEDTLFPIGSATKAFTATLLAMIMEQQPGRFSWDTHLKDILGSDFALFDQSLTEQVTLRDIMSHRTGIPGYFLPIMAGFPQNMTRKQLTHNLRYFPPSHPLRTTLLYNNYMYMLAGHVAEVLEGQEWESMNTERLFTPLGMTSSMYVRDITDSTHIAEAHTVQDGDLVRVNRSTLHQVDLAAPAGAIVSTARDMSHWLQLHLHQGKLSCGDYLLSPEGLRQTYETQMAAPDQMSERDLKRPQYPVADVHVAYDLGWMTNYYRGYKRVWHSGGITTYKSMVWIYPDADIAMFLSINGPPNSGSTWGLILVLQYLSDILLGETPWLDTETICSFPQPWEEPYPENTVLWPNDTLRRPAQEYAGVYVHPGFGELSISLSSSTSDLELRMGRFFTAKLLYNRTSDTFITEVFGELWYSEERIPVRFLEKSDHTIQALSLPLSSPYETSQPMVFMRKDQLTSAPNARTSRASLDIRSTFLPQAIAFSVIMLLTSWDNTIIML